MLYTGLVAFVLALAVLVLDVVGVASGAGAFVNVVLPASLLLLALSVAKLGHHHHHLFRHHPLSH